MVKEKNLDNFSLSLNYVCMDTQFSIKPTSEKFSRWTFWLVGIALFSGFILSILSWLEVCVEHCAANQDYLLFGLPFAIIGIAFFALLLILHSVSNCFSLISQWVEWMIAGALGAELMFLAVQKFQIGHWCPVCLSIAASVSFAAILLSAGYFTNLINSIQLHNRGVIMEKIKHGFSTLAFILAGFLMAFIGISNPNSADAVAANMKERLAFGLKNSSIEVYYVTDWFCPSCKKIEPLMEKLYPQIRAKATFFFVDYAIHRKSMNFTPYHLAFLLNDKPHYFKGRQLLSYLTDKTEAPKDEEVEQAARKEGIAFKEIAFVDVKSGMEFFDKIVDQYKLNSTPTLIFTNQHDHRVIKLEGREEITEEKVLDALKKIGKS